MRSVLTVIIFIILLVLVLLYKMTGPGKMMDGFRGSGHAKGYGSDTTRNLSYGWLGFLPFVSTLSETPIEEEDDDIENQPCSTDLQCSTGHCSMFGMCTNGLSL
jgi:hypothetical protein